MDLQAITSTVEAAALALTQLAGGRTLNALLALCSALALLKVYRCAVRA